MSADATPVPERNPARPDRLKEQPPPLPSAAMTIPWSKTEIIAAKVNYTQALSSIQLDYELLPQTPKMTLGSRLAVNFSNELPTA
jgi:hypothetical protein